MSWYNPLSWMQSANDTLPVVESAEAVIETGSFFSNWMTPYAWTPTWAPKIIQAAAGYSDEELGLSSFAPLVMSDAQNDAFVVAVAAQRPLHWALQYLMVPSLIAGGIKLVDRFLPSLPEMPLVPSFIQKFAKGFFKYLVLPQMISSFLHTSTSGPKLLELYERMTPLTVAFMRPFFERILPSVSKMLESEGITLSLRKMFISENSAAVTIWFGRMLKVLSGKTAAIGFWEVNARHAYSLAQMTVIYAENLIKFTRNFLWGIGQIPSSLTSPPKAWEAINKVLTYCEPQLNWLSANVLAPVSSITGEWSRFIGSALLDGAKRAPFAAWNALGMCADAFADVIGAESWYARPVAQAVGYVVPTIVVGSGLYYAGKCTKDLYFRTIEETILPKRSLKTDVTLAITDGSTEGKVSAGRKRSASIT